MGMNHISDQMEGDRRNVKISKYAKVNKGLLVLIVNTQIALTNF